MQHAFQVKMTKYHYFAKFVAIQHCFGTNEESTTFLVLELYKLEFLVNIPPWHYLTWHLGIKKSTWYSSFQDSSTVLVCTRVSITRVWLGYISEIIQVHTRVSWTRVLCQQYPSPLSFSVFCYIMVVIWVHSEFIVWLVLLLSLNFSI